MKILYHHRTASRDGQAVHIDEMVHALRSIGHEVMVVAPSARAPSTAMGGQLDWVQRLRLVLPGLLYELLELSYSVPAWWRLRRAARDFAPDLLYERYNLHMLAGTWLARQLGIPLFLEVNAPLAQERREHDRMALERLAHWTEGRVWRAADRLFAVSGVMAEHVVSRGIEPGRVVVTPNGVNLQHFESAPDPLEARRRLGWGDALILGFTGFVRPWHGVDRVIRWLASPQAPAGAHLLIVGDGPARPALESLARELGVLQRVRFTGMVDRAAVPALVSAFDIGLQPAVVGYASPLKIFEYMALAKPIIAPAQPNIREILKHGVDALLFDPALAHDFETQLQRLADDPELRMRLGGAARLTLLERGLTWHHNARRIVQEAQQGSHRSGVRVCSKGVQA